MKPVGDYEWNIYAGEWRSYNVKCLQICSWIHNRFTSVVQNLIRYNVLRIIIYRNNCFNCKWGVATFQYQLSVSKNSTSICPHYSVFTREIQYSTPDLFHSKFDNWSDVWIRLNVKPSSFVYFIRLSSNHSLVIAHRNTNFRAHFQFHH